MATRKNNVTYSSTSKPRSSRNKYLNEVDELSQSFENIKMHKEQPSKAQRSYKTKYENEVPIPRVDFTKKCHVCDEIGHFDMECPMFLKAVEEQSYNSQRKNKKQGSNSRAASERKGSDYFEDYMGSCQYCDEVEHIGGECLVKPMYEFYSKKCHICDEIGHFDMECPLFLNAVEEQSGGSRRNNRKQRSKKN